jgi:hypothetical protein
VEMAAAAGGDPAMCAGDVLGDIPNVLSDTFMPYVGTLTTRWTSDWLGRGLNSGAQRTYSSTAPVRSLTG